MRRKIWCDGWKRKYFGLGWEVNKALVSIITYSVYIHLAGPYIPRYTHMRVPYIWSFGMFFWHVDVMFIIVDINECLYRDKYPCHGVCMNTIGSFTCDCPTGTRGNASMGECHKHPFPPRARVASGTRIFLKLLHINFYLWNSHVYMLSSVWLAVEFYLPKIK
jgi:hypothetical protein